MTSAVVAPTEVSPLLGDRPGCVEDTENGRPRETDDPERPPMAKKMHLLIPAVGIGV